MAFPGSVGGGSDASLASAPGIMTRSRGDFAAVSRPRESCKPRERARSGSPSVRGQRPQTHGDAESRTTAVRTTARFSRRNGSAQTHRSRSGNKNDSDCLQ
ncbi:hypothetical protein AAFF_G00056970 [Aldrovandia affinis]|uniref:Uncharacterized protein n=1 Tax=Aldrovandia affinis TaxID=143900 RepID=A0AAD7S0N1_9TELE|nr:hypothetical protein AAFF_G00056970 [Aldrovandia affinis]